MDSDANGFAFAGALVVGQIFAERFSVHGRAVEMQQIPDLVHQGAQAAGVPRGEFG